MPEISCDELTELVEQGKNSGRPVCYKENNLPLYLPFNQQIYAYLEQAVSGLIPRSVYALIEKFDGLQIVNRNNQSFVNINTPSQWHEYTESKGYKHKSMQEK
jgi:molybdopterin-guanine dinucleotide biosynthesis protein A